LVNQFGEELRLMVQPKLSVFGLQTTIETVCHNKVSLTLVEPNQQDVFIALTQDKETFNHKPPISNRMAYLDEDQSVFSNLIETGLWSDGYCSLYPVIDKQAIVEEIRAARAKAGLLVEKDFSALLIEND
jgi:hypothetical protein